MQPKLKTKPKLKPILILILTLVLKMTSILTLTILRKTVAAQKQKNLFVAETAGPSQAPTTGLIRADRQVILIRDKNIQLPNKMVQEIM